MERITDQLGDRPTCERHHDESDDTEHDPEGARIRRGVAEAGDGIETTGLCRLGELRCVVGHEPEREALGPESKVARQHLIPGLQSFPDQLIRAEKGLVPRRDLLDQRPRDRIATALA